MSFKGFILGNLLLLWVPQVRAEEMINAHEDVFSVNFDSATGNLMLTARDETSKREYRSDHLFHRVPVGAKLSIPNPTPPAFTFLGPPGSPIWILPQTQNASLPYLGVSAENKTGISGWQAIGVPVNLTRKGFAAGVFVGNVVVLRLLSKRGPGEFAVYSTSAAGTPTVAINTRDGLTAADKITANPNTHAHFNWAFSAKGFYQITIQASATRSSDNKVVVSPPATYFFGVEAAPYTYANWSAGYETSYNLPANTLSTNPQGDPDGDGLNNAIEYALQWMGADPLIANFGLLDGTKVAGQLTLDYFKDSLKTSYLPRPQASENLSQWFFSGNVGAPPGFVDSLNETRTAPGTVEQRQATLSIGTPERGFLRLQVSP